MYYTPYYTRREHARHRRPLEARAEGSVSEYVRRQLFNDQPSLEAVLDRIDHLADDIAEGRPSPEPSSFQSHRMVS